MRARCRSTGSQKSVLLGAKWLIAARHLIAYTTLSVFQVAAMQKAMWDPQVRQALIFPEPAEPGDAFEMILNELEAKVDRVRHKRAEYLRKHGQ